MSQIIVITGASSGFGNLTAKALAHAGHTVYAGMRDPTHDNPSVQELEAYSEKESVTLLPVALNVISEESLQAGITKIVEEAGRIDVLIHNAGHMTYGPTEAFTTEQLIATHNVNCFGTHRLNRVALPYMREAGTGLVIWVGSSSVRGGAPPFLGPYFAAKAAMDSLAQTYAGELTQWGIETSIIVPGAYTTGTNHFANAGSPDDNAVAAAYMEGPYKSYDKKILEGQAAVEPKDSDPNDVARAIVDVVATPLGKRPFRVHIGTQADRAHIVSPMADFAREQTMRDMGVGDLLDVHSEDKGTSI